MPNINTTDLEQKPFIPIQDLEDIFNEILMGHISPNHYFLNRNEKNTSIPQFNEDSYFITHYSDDIYQDTLKVLDDHYQYLCNEEDSIMDKSMNNNY